ncbi:ATP-grasp domain-containing protein [Aspergillus cavernicola]|uniref:ATP-grasp domain-containing protein n=1 Tax=Aspergillus cavernicola TaxID=176166 RepID=A0ABR4IMM0_9EURO
MTVQIESELPQPNFLQDVIQVASEIWHCSSEQDIAWTKLDTQGWASSTHSSFFLQALESALASRQGRSAIRLIFPSSTGYRVRSDIFALRTVDLECSSSAVSFFATQPGKATGGVLLQSPLSADQDYGDVFRQLDAELANRLTFPWLTASPPPRKTLALVEGGRSSPEHGGVAASLYTAAQALNIDMIVLDVPGHWLQGPQYSHWRKEFLEVCHTPPPEAYEIATDKYRTAVSEGRPAYLARGIDEALEIARRETTLEYPLIVKPCNGFLSEGVSRVDSPNELFQALAIVNLDRHGTEVVLEAYCDGPEVGINFVLADGDLLFCEVSDDFPKTADHLPANEIHLLRESLHQSLTRLSLTTGIYHLEARVQHSSFEYRSIHTDPNPDQANELIDLVPRLKPPRKTPTCWLIEINPRPPGIQETAAPQYMTTPRLRALAHPFQSGAQYWSEMVFIPVSSRSGAIFDSDDVCADLKMRRPDLAGGIDGVQGSETGVTAWIACYVVFSRESRRHLIGVAEDVKRETLFTIV